MEEKKEDHYSEFDMMEVKMDAVKELMIKIKAKEVFQSSKEYPTDELAGVYHGGIQYFDFRNVKFINNTVMAKLIYLLNPLLKQGIKIKLENTTENIKNKIKSMGLDNIFNVC